MSELPCPHEPEPAPKGSLEDLLFLALERLDAEGVLGVQRFLAEHPAEAPRLRAHLEQLHRIGLSIRVG